MTTPSSTTPLTKRRAETRAKILRAAVEVFAEQGIVASTVDQICQRAGFTRGAFYSNFDSKNAVCLELIAVETQFYADAFRRGATAIAGHFGADPELLRRPAYELAEQMIELILYPFVAEDDDRAAQPSNLSLLYTELGLYAAREPAIRAAYNAYADGMSAPFEQLLSPLLALGGLEFAVPPQEAAELITALYEAATRKALMIDSPSRVVEAIKPEVLLGLRMVTRPIQPKTVDPRPEPTG